MQQLMKKTIGYSVAFAAVSMAVIVYMASHKVVVIADVAQDEVRTMDREAGQERGPLSFGEGEGDANYLCIPLPGASKAEAVKIENYYMSKELWVIFENDYSDFYGRTSITGNRDNIKFGYCESEESGTMLKFSLTGVYEYRSILEENNLYIEFLPPGELHEKIVVIDPAGGKEQSGASAYGLAEKDVVLGIARKLKEKLDITDIKVYYTRMEDVYPEEETRVSIANDVKADMLIRIEVGESQDTMDFGTSAVYNERYFIPDFGSVELADLLEREVVTSIKGKALGLEPAGEGDYVIQEAEIPAAGIKVGHITNEKEASLLRNEIYLDYIASGIYQAIIKAYEGEESTELLQGE